MPTENVLPFIQPNEEARAYEQDLLDLFTFKRQGHMEQWSYAEAAYPGDPASGQEPWKALIKQPGPYYPPRSDIDMITRALQHSGISAVLRDITTVVELGPGSAESITQKTLPFLRHAQNYIAVDLNTYHAQQAADQIHDALSIPTQVCHDHYLSPRIEKVARGKAGFIMWGVSIGNIEGRPGEDPKPLLLESLSSLADCCNPGDTVFISVDTGRRAEFVSNAYNTPLMCQKLLSILYDAKRSGLISGHFTPEDWTHRAVWHEQTGQCGLYLIAGADQDFMLSGQRIIIPAGKAVLAINSYKFSPVVMEETARLAGFSRVFMSDDTPVAMLMATK